MIVDLNLPDNGHPSDPRLPAPNVAKFRGPRGPQFWPADVSESVVIQCNVIRDMQRFGPDHPSGVDDPYFGTPLTLGQFFDAQALCMTVLAEVEERGATDPFAHLKEKA